MVKMELITPPQPPTKFDFLEYLKQHDKYYYESDNYYYEFYDLTPTLADLETSPYLLQWFEDFQTEKLRKNIFKEYFYGDWRRGQEFQKVIITQRLYQTSPNTTQA